MAQLRLTDTRVLWPALMAGPVAWTVQLQWVYALSAWATERDNPVLLHVISALCLLATVAGGLVAYRAWRTVGGLPSGTEDPDTARIRYLGVLGMMTGTLFTCVIVAQWIAVMALPWRFGAG